MKVKVDRNLCVGAGNCVVIAPKVFKLDAKNKAIVLDPTSAGEDTLREAAESCPASAIILEDDEGNQVFP